MMIVLAIVVLSVAVHRGRHPLRVAGWRCVLNMSVTDRYDIKRQMTRDREPGLRERTRLAVRREIALAAETLFLERGYHATTINDIAQAVNMSPRSLFRYFPTKEDIMLEKLDKVLEEMVEALRQLPLDQTAWASLRRMLDGMTEHVNGTDAFAVAEPIKRIMLETPDMLARYLVKLNGFQNEVADVLRARAEAKGQPYAADDAAPRALAGAAVSCLVVAQQMWLSIGAATGMSDLLDRAMQAVATEARD
jgi:AcrR family transcriptional regulator